MATALIVCFILTCISFAYARDAADSSTTTGWPLITPAPTLAIAPRAKDLGLWGYVSGNSNSPMSCPSGFTFTYDGIGQTLVACCNGVTCTNDYHMCNDYLGTACPDPDICSTIYTEYLQCPAETPSCALYARITGPQDGNTKSSFACGDSGGIFLVLPTITGTATTNAAESSTSQSTTDYVSYYNGLLSSNMPSTASSVKETSSTTSSNKASNPTTSSSHSKSGGGMDAATKATIAGAIIAGVTVPLMILGIFAAVLPVQTLKCITCGRRPRPKHTPTGEVRPATNPELRPAIVNAGITRINQAFHPQQQSQPQRYTMNYYPQPQPQYQPQYQPLYPQQQYR